MLWMMMVGCGLLGGPEGIRSESPSQEDAAALSNPAGTPTHPGSVPAPKTDNSGNQSTHNAVVVGKDDAGNKGVRVGGDKGVVVGANNEVDGVRIGGEYGVIAGSTDDTKGVRVGGSNGVMLGADDDTKGVRVGGKKGVVIDGKKGIKIGGKKLFGK